MTSGLRWHFLEGRWACGLIQHAFQVLVVPTGLSILRWADGASSLDVLKVCRGWAKGIGSFGSPGSFFLMPHLLHHKLVLLSARRALMFLAQDPSSFLDMHLCVSVVGLILHPGLLLLGFMSFLCWWLGPPLSLLRSGTIRITTSVWLVILIQSWSSAMVSGSWEKILPATCISSVVVFFHWPLDFLQNWWVFPLSLLPDSKSIIVVYVLHLLQHSICWPLQGFRLHEICVSFSFFFHPGLGYKISGFDLHSCWWLWLGGFCAQRCLMEKSFLLVLGVLTLSGLWWMSSYWASFYLIDLPLKKHWCKILTNSKLFQALSPGLIDLMLLVSGLLWPTTTAALELVTWWNFQMAKCSASLLSLCHFCSNFWYHMVRWFFILQPHSRWLRGYSLCWPLCRNW